jgi:hypothetical protein
VIRLGVTKGTSAQLGGLFAVGVGNGAEGGLQWDGPRAALHPSPGVMAAVRELLEGLRGVGDDERRTLWRARIAGSVFYCSNAAPEWQAELSKRKPGIDGGLPTRGACSKVSYCRKR